MTNYAKLKGELAMHKRAQYGKGCEKPKETSESKSASDVSKDEEEDEEELLTASKLESIPVLNELARRALALLAKIKCKLSILTSCA